MDTIAKMICIWVPFWAIRRKGDLDCKLNRTAQITRWAIIAICYALMSLPGINFGRIRVAGALVGLAFFCWPNFACHLAGRFQKWPMTEGTVESSEERSSSRWSVPYYFEFGGQTYGGTSIIKPIPGMGPKQAIRKQEPDYPL